MKKNYNMKYHNSKETIDKIKEFIIQKKSGVYLRFGDGDINLANGINDLYQQKNDHLKTEMIESLSLKGENIIKSLPLNCKEYGGWEEGMYPGNHECSKEWADDLLNKVSKFWGGPFEDIYSSTALHFLSTNNLDYCVDFLNLIKKNKNNILVGNQDIPSEITTKLFGPETKHIKTPTSNSYSSIDDIELQLSETINSYNNEFILIIVAMGCSGRILEKRIIKKYNNIFLFDFGSLLDALCGWNNRAWITLNNFDKNIFLNKIN